MNNKNQPRESSSTLWYELSDANLLIFAEQFQKVCSQYQADLGVSDGDLEEIQESQQLWATSYADMVSVRALAEGATANKNIARTTMTDVFRKYVAEFQANPNIPEEVYAQLQIPKRGSRGSRGAAFTPSDVIAKAGGIGEVIITFKRNGNPSSALFTIQQLTPSGWSNLMTSSRTRYKLTGFPAGVPVSFRVIATRGLSVSTPSNTVSVWANGDTGSTTLQIAA